MSFWKREKTIKSYYCNNSIAESITDDEIKRLEKVYNNQLIRYVGIEDYSFFDFTMSQLVSVNFLSNEKYLSKIKNSYLKKIKLKSGDCVNFKNINIFLSKFNNNDYICTLYKKIDKDWITWFSLAKYEKDKFGIVNTNLEPTDDGAIIFYLVRDSDFVYKEKIKSYYDECDLERYTEKYTFDLYIKLPIVQFENKEDKWFRPKTNNYDNLENNSIYYYSDDDSVYIRLYECDKDGYLIDGGEIYNLKIANGDDSLYNYHIVAKNKNTGNTKHLFALERVLTDGMDFTFFTTVAKYDGEKKLNSTGYSFLKKLSLSGIEDTINNNDVKDYFFMYATTPYVINFLPTFKKYLTNVYSYCNKPGLRTNFDILNYRIGNFDFVNYMFVISTDGEAKITKSSEYCNFTDESKGANTLLLLVPLEIIKKSTLKEKIILRLTLYTQFVYAKKTVKIWFFQTEEFMFLVQVATMISSAMSGGVTAILTSIVTSILAPKIAELVIKELKIKDDWAKIAIQVGAQLTASGGISSFNQMSTMQQVNYSVNVINQVMNQYGSQEMLEYSRQIKDLQDELSEIQKEVNEIKSKKISGEIMFEDPYDEINIEYDFENEFSLDIEYNYDDEFNLLKD